MPARKLKSWSLKEIAQIIVIPIVIGIISSAIYAYVVTSTAPEPLIYIRIIQTSFNFPINQPHYIAIQFSNYGKANCAYIHFKINTRDGIFILTPSSNITIYPQSIIKSGITYDNKTNSEWFTATMSNIEPYEYGYISFIVSNTIKYPDNLYVNISDLEGCASQYRIFTYAQLENNSSLVNAKNLTIT